MRTTAARSVRYRPRFNGIHIMTDTDDTREFATAYYGDVVARSSPSVRNDDLDRSDLEN